MASLRWLAVGMLLGCGSSSSTPPPTLSSVCPKPVQAPTLLGQTFTGTFVLRGSALAEASVITDGPLLLEGEARVNASGTQVEQDYRIGCCAPREGQAFTLTVRTGGGEASIADSVTLTVPPACTP